MARRGGLPPLMHRTFVSRERGLRVALPFFFAICENGKINFQIYALRIALSTDPRFILRCRQIDETDTEQSARARAASIFHFGVKFLSNPSRFASEMFSALVTICRFSSL